ncbi:hypothetical protein I302_109120 [Kwoniella bestiolae CBS 10118]|uniref:Class III aminotransferase n=1 Tax=Kwoniella bestiolae CBS 10118 TaxID=1296100 RepID=A0A1B9FV29_9TREE|nr:class III aminotransferase [Kwoniella bestiolae CBS 10118]OCF22615.1 class III aminotransferase [Kwoniella bestiolae CBS 10118]
MKSETAQLHHTSAQPLVISSTGLEYTLETGQVILDAISGGAAVNCLGNGNKEISDVMVAQVEKMAYAYHQALGNEQSEKLALFLTERSGGGLKAAAFLNSGSEAMEAALKLAREYWVGMGQPSRTQIIGRFPSYHGNTLGVLSAGNVPARRTVYEPLLSTNTHHVPSPQYKRRHHPNESEEAYSARLAAELESKIQAIGPENVMCFVAEAVVGAALGVMPPPKGYFPAIKKVLDKYDILLILDEVMSGSGRSGELFAFQAVGEGVIPDIMAMAKGLGSGYVAVSSVLTGERVTDRIRKSGGWKNSHSYQNHPISCAVALKVQEIVERDSLLANVRARGEQLIQELQESTKGIEMVYDIRGKGLFVGVELTGSSSLEPRLAARIKSKTFQNGLLVMAMSGTVDGVEGESIMLGPAYTVTKEQISEIVRLLTKSIKEVAADLEKEN